MNKEREPMKISTRLSLVLGLVLVLAGIFLVVLINDRAHRQALIEAEEKAKIILDRNLATHTYFSQKLKPTLFKFTEPIRSEVHFEPIWMSSTYAIREIEKYFKALEQNDYYYKECAINARSPENEADAYETSFLNKL